jgi:hypothetical protein
VAALKGHARPRKRKRIGMKRKVKTSREVLHEQASEAEFLMSQLFRDPIFARHIAGAALRYLEMFYPAEYEIARFMRIVDTKEPMPEANSIDPDQG